MKSVRYDIRFPPKCAGPGGSNDALESCKLAKGLGRETCLPSAIIIRDKLYP